MQTHFSNTSLEKSVGHLEVDEPLVVVIDSIQIATTALPRGINGSTPAVGGLQTTDEADAPEPQVGGCLEYFLRAQSVVGAEGIRLDGNDTWPPLQGQELAQKGVVSYERLLLDDDGRGAVECLRSALFLQAYASGMNKIALEINGPARFRCEV